MSEENDSEGIAGLRKQYEEQKKALDTLLKENEELKTEKRNQSVTELFKAKGLPETAAKHFHGEVSEDAVVAFATDLGLLKADEASNENNQSDANADAARRLSQNSGGSQGLNISPGPGGRVLGSPQEIQLALDTLNYKELVDLGLMPADPNRL